MDLLCGALGALGAVFRAALFAIRNTRGIERAAHHVIANAGKILHAASADQHNGVLLQIVADAGDVGGDLDSVGQPDARDFAQRRVRLLGRSGIHAGAHAATLRASLQRRTGSLIACGATPLAHELNKSRQNSFLTSPPHPAHRTRACAMSTSKLLKPPRNQGTGRYTLNTAVTDPKFTARVVDFGLAHTHASVESREASGPAPSRTLHQKSGSTGAEDQPKQIL